jgi:hypothetical protein
MTVNDLLMLFIFFNVCSPVTNMDPVGAVDFLDVSSRANPIMLPATLGKPLPKTCTIVDSLQSDRVNMPSLNCLLVIASNILDQTPRAERVAAFSPDQKGLLRFVKF